MTDDTMPLLDALLKRGGGDFMKSLAEEVLARLMAFDVEGQSVALVGATRLPEGARKTYRRSWAASSAFVVASPPMSDSWPLRMAALAFNSHAHASVSGGN